MFKSKTALVTVNETRMCCGGIQRDYLKGEENIGSLQQNCCCKIADARVKASQGKKYLSVHEKDTIQHISGDVTKMESDEELAAVAMVEGL